jgi:myo-inositol-1(or 4)-monophosphatase
VEEFKKIGKETVLKAGDYLLQNIKNPTLINEKHGGADLLTTADKEAEEIIASELHKQFPTHAIFSEESGDMYGGDEFQWVMDPLDGTKHYMKGLPFFAVSLVLRNEKEPLLSFVYIPLTGEFFDAEKGKGATYNTKPCTVSGVDNIANAIIYVEFPSSKFKIDWQKEDYNKAWRKYENLTRACFRTRAYGSGPIGMAYTAIGGFDAFVRFSPLVYEDVLGGSLLIEEAGGEVSDQNNKKLDIKGHDLNARVVASNVKIHDQILKIIRP